MKRTEFRGDGWQFPFVKYAPDNESDGLPVIIQLHGAGERGRGREDLVLVDAHGFTKMISAGGEYPCIFIMPQCPKESFWAARVESIVEFVERVKKEFNADPDRVYLTGLSMGGYGTWYTAMARPDLFAAIAPVCGGGMAWNAEVLTMPVWAFHGAEDKDVSPTQSDEMVEALEKCGADVRYTRLDGVGHNVWNYAYNKELFDWLMAQKRA